MLTQLNPPLYFWVPQAKDHGLAIAVIDYHMDHDLYWVCIMDKTGAVATLSNKEVRGCMNTTIGRTLGSTEVPAFLKPQGE